VNKPLSWRSFPPQKHPPPDFVFDRDGNVLTPTHEVWAYLDKDAIQRVAIALGKVSNEQEDKDDKEDESKNCSSKDSEAINTRNGSQDRKCKK
jgi:hypothetical protein